MSHLSWFDRTGSAGYQRRVSIDRLRGGAGARYALSPITITPSWAPPDPA
jgi:hypothetical protein